MSTTVYLIRNSNTISKDHFKSIDNDLNYDILTINGEKEAEKLSQNKEFQNIDAIYSSAHNRAIGTAKYFAKENKTIINIDKRLNERKIGNLKDEYNEFYRSQSKNFDYKLPNGESLNETKKRMTDALRNILMFEADNRIIVFSHSIALTCLLAAWCEVGKNYDGEIILTYKDRTIVDGRWNNPTVFKVTFDGLQVIDIECLENI